MTTDVGIGLDAKELRFEICSLLEGPETRIRPQHGLLHQVFGVGALPGHLHGPAEKRVQERDHVTFETRCQFGVGLVRDRAEVAIDV